MAHCVASISPLVAFCAVIPSVGVGTILFNNTFFSQEKNTQPKRAAERLKTTFFTYRLSLLEQIILGTWYGYL
jgi:hypothetical protein